MNTPDIDPDVYFKTLKEKKQTVTDGMLSAVYDNCMDLLNKYKVSGQVKGMKKLIFLLETIEREREIIKLGINTFVYRDDIEEYIDDVAKNTVKIIDLESYEREIPDEIVDILSKVHHLFDKFYVVFTDYTGKVERKVAAERRSADPILFGTFQRPDDRMVLDRFYFIGDWVDEHCDLTLDKMAAEFKSSRGRSITRTIQTPADIEALKQELANLESDGQGNFIQAPDGQRKKKTFFSRIRTFLGDLLR